MSTKKEIVRRVEARLASHIIDTAKCLPGCKCTVCFHKYLDSVLNASDAITPKDAIELVEYVG